MTLKISSMFLGKKETFAIEAYLNQGEGCVFIRYCFWVRNSMIGDINQQTLLTSVMAVLENVLKLKGQRYFPDLAEYKATEILTYLVHALWQLSPSALPIHTTYADEELKRTDINSHEGESFQGFYVFLLEYDSYDWLICQEHGKSKVFEIKIPKSIFYTVIEKTARWIRDSTMLVLRPEFID